MGWIVREAKMYASLPFLLLVFFLLPYHYSSAVPYGYSTYYPYQDRISVNGEPINLSQPSRDLDCRLEGQECSIILNVTYMQTMTVYEYNSFADREVGGRRGDDGYAVNVTADGMLRLKLSSPSYPVNEFLYPILADGERRTVIAINNQVPGPTIIANQGQTLQVTVVNNLATESLSIHWHGQHAVDTPWMDGVAQLTQCPIPSFTNFTYRFTLDQVGTHWYHAHNGAQRTDGLHGALIVTSDSEFKDADDKPREFVDLPEQHTLIFIDWQVTDSISVMEIIASGSRFQDPIDANRVYLNTLTYDRSEAAPMPFVSGLINGAGWRYTPGSPCTRIDDQNIPLAVFDVEEGKTYRFRLIGAQNAYAFRFSIQGHTMTLLSSDGVPVEEKTTTGGVDYIVIHSGERYDVLVRANSPSPSIVKGNYWMTAETLEHPALLTQRGYCVKGHRSYALLHYRHNPHPQWPPNDTVYNPVTNPKCNQITCYAANCPFSKFPAEYNIECINVGTMQQRAPLPIPNTDVSASAFLNFGFAGVTTVQGSSINGRHFLFPPGPLVTQYSSLSTFWNDNICSYSRGESEIRGRRCTHTYRVHTGTVELVLMNYIIGQQINTTQAHPVHLHGHHFRVVKIGYGNCTSGICFNSDIECGNEFCDYNVSWASGSPTFNTNNMDPRAVTKDTVIVPPGGYVVLRFERDNPGYWFLHCHIEPHQLEGMAMVIDESSNIPTAPNDFPECGNYPRNTCIVSSYTGVGIALGCLTFVVFMQHIMTLL